MKMLDELKEVIDDIEVKNDWEYKFICDILERKENDINYKLSIKQFNIVDRIHQKYVGY